MRLVARFASLSLSVTKAAVRTPFSVAWYFLSRLARSPIVVAGVAALVYLSPPDQRTRLASVSLFAFGTAVLCIDFPKYTLLGTAASFLLHYWGLLSGPLFHVL